MLLNCEQNMYNLLCKETFMSYICLSLILSKGEKIMANNQSQGTLGFMDLMSIAVGQIIGAGVMVMSI